MLNAVDHGQANANDRRNDFIEDTINLLSE